MADEPGNPETRPREGADGDLMGQGGGARDWRLVWQVPALVAAGALLLAGVGALLMGGPKPDLDAMIKRAEVLITRQEYQPALDQLNKTVRPWYDAAALSPDQVRRFHLARARAVYLGQRDLGLDLPENARSIVDEYAAAAREEPLNEPRDLYFLAESHVTLGLHDRAIELARSIPKPRAAESGEADWSAVGLTRIYRRVIERLLREAKPDGELALRLLTEFLRDAAPSAADRAWALARQAEILIRTGSHDAAIARLLRLMPGLLPEITPEDAGELYLLLGQAYIQSGALVEAGRQLRAALEFLLDTDERWARATVLLARVDEAMGDPIEDAQSEARLKYLAVIARFDGSEERLAALLGLAEVEAAMGDHDAAASAFGRLVDSIIDGGIHPEVSPDVVTASLLARWRGQHDIGAHETALRYAILAERLARRPGAPSGIASEGPGSATRSGQPPEVLLAIARSHRALADMAFGEASGASLPPPTGESRAQRIAALDPATRQAVRAHLASAGRYFKMHADTVGIADNVAFGESLWQAAEAHDLAGDLDASIPLFADYVKYFPGDPRRAEARFRLGRAYQARGDYAVAAEQYQALIADARTLAGRVPAGSESEPAVAGIGPYADLSMVPLAQALLLDGDPANDGQAEAVLNEVVAGRIGSASTPQFREGLIELGFLLQRRGEYAAAIGRLEEAVSRFPNHPGVESVRFQLAEANRQDAMAIRRTLAEAMPDHRKQMLRQARLERLRRAEELYEQVRRALELKDARRRTRLENVQLRNSYFYLGDCAFELGDFDAAILRYDAARERFPDDPAALVAMVQIVNAYVEQGDLERAATANERARRFYQGLPQSAWNDPDLPMSHEDWQRWLDSMTALRPLRPQGETGSATAGVEERAR